MNNRNYNVFASVYLGLGTNLGNKEENIEIALKNIEKQIGKILSRSAFYSSEPSGFESENMFLNCAVEISTSLQPYELLTKTQLIEKEMGRLEKSDASGYSDRIMDIDVLFYGNLIVDDVPTLVIPHPFVQQRDFVLQPLSEIAPDYVHPVLCKTIMQLLNVL